MRDGGESGSGDVGVNAAAMKGWGDQLFSGFIRISTCLCLNDTNVRLELELGGDTSAFLLEF